MKTINKSAKSIVSLVLAVAMLIGSLFVANVGININASAETADTATSGKILTWNGGTETPTADSNGVYIIDTAEKLAWVSQSSGSGGTGKTYKIADDIAAFVMQNYTDEATLQAFMALDTADEVMAWFADTESYGTPTSWTCGEFYGTLDGNGATIYGIYASSGTNLGLFATANGATVKNLAVKKSYVSSTNNAGILFSQGKWSIDATLGYALTVTIENCVIEDNYIMGTNSAGALIGNAGYSGLVINNCLVADNAHYKSDGTVNAWATFVGGSDATSSTGTAVPTTLSNSIGIGVIPKAGNVSASKTISNCYTTINISYDGAPTLFSNMSADLMKGVMVKSNMSALPWATDEVNGEGYWHVVAGNYPTPIKPDGWKDIILADVWDGTAATAFAGGSGTEDDPFIIENAEQLYKMVKDGGRIWNEGDVVSYTPAYYKIADGVTDLYLNAVQGGDLDTLKGLVTAGTAINWSQGFDVCDNATSDLDGDGYADEMAAFIGVFDGNGVTIHGLYSASSGVVNDGWCTTRGIGFVPAMTGNAIIKNVSFDKSYIHSGNYNAAVVTTSFGLDNTGSETFGSTGKTKLTSINYENCYVSLYNIAVRNAYVYSSVGDDANYPYNFGSCGGLVSSYKSPNKAVFVNCMYDGYSSELSAPNRSACDQKAGIISTGKTSYGYRLINCVSLGAYPMSNDANISFDSMKNIGFINTYTDIKNKNTIEYILGQPEEVSVKSAYEQSDMSALNWSQWSLVAVENDRIIPMPTGVTTANLAGVESLKELVLSQVGGAGNYNYVGAQNEGTYGHYHKLTGSGTAEDPYLISTALQLADAISTGGVNISQKLHYKLTNDIDLYGLDWIDTDDGAEPTDTDHSKSYENGYWDTRDTGDISDDKWVCQYSYVPFAGTLDGDGYAIYGLNAASGGALIPEFNGGTVKNLHIRNSSASTAIIAASGSGTIEGCSAEDCYTGTANTFVSGTATIKNSYYDNTYYLADGTTGTPTDSAVWYKGGADGCTPKLVNRAKAMPCADIDGDGKGDEYSTSDLIALKNKLLKKSEYANVYGDVSKNGKVNSSDLVILTREVAEDYQDIKDGFWRNLALGNFAIYYGENDNYDAARKLELYLEAAAPDVDVKKVVVTDTASTLSWGTSSNSATVYVHNNDMAYTVSDGKLYSPALDTNGNYNSATEYASTSAEYSKYALDGKLQIIVGDVSTYTNSLADNTYSITYDKENGVLWLQGENFTAVEQAVLDFINKSDINSSYAYTVGSTTLSAEKQPRTINGTTYYYTWGDEFEGIDGTVSENNWEYSNNTTESAYERNGNADQGKYINMEMALNSDLNKLFVIEEVDGESVLSMKRGVYTTTAVNAYDYEWLDSTGRNLGYVGIEVPALVDGKAYNSVDDTINLTGDTDTDDIYINSGKIVSENSLLVKQGYFEFRASFPSDGHSFPCWWLMGEASGGNNNAYTESLYGKIYKYNNIGDNKYVSTKGNSIDSADIATYKYQLPNAFFEIDVFELMQDITNLPSTTCYTQAFSQGTKINFRTDDAYALTGFYDYIVPFNLHKYYSLGVNAKGANTKSIINWTDNGGVYDEDYKGLTMSKIDNGNSPDWIKSVENPVQHTFGGGNATEKYYTTLLNTIDVPTMEYNATSQAALTAMRRYGFEWTVTESNFVYTLYIFDPDGNGVEDDNNDGVTEGDDYVKYTMDSSKTLSGINMETGATVTKMKSTGDDIGFVYNEDGHSGTVDPVSDLEVANQYMYFLIDNKFWTANQYYGGDGSTPYTTPEMFTDLLTQENTGEKTCFDIDYIRVYQAEGRRDIVTPETESFNNGNHFGY